MATPLTWVMVRPSPSTSLSLPRTSTEIEPSSATVKLSFCCHRRVVDRRHRAGDRRHRRDRAVGDRVRERGRTVVVRRRREHELARHQMRPMPLATATAGPPSVMAAPLTCVIVRLSPSTSLSLPRTSTVIEPSSATVKLSFGCHRRVVDRGDRARDRRHGRDRAIGDRVGERTPDRGSWPPV